MEKTQFETEQSNNNDATVNEKKNDKHSYVEKRMSPSNIAALLDQSSDDDGNYEKFKWETNEN